MIRSMLKHGLLLALASALPLNSVVAEVGEGVTHNEAVAGDELPNIIVILADDLGYGDIGSFGAAVATPRIDQLAAEGLKLTEFYAAAPVCTPSRAGLLTGRLAARMGMQHVFLYDAHDGMPQDEITIAEQLQQVGYDTGMVGKWHLGHLDRYMPWNQGFEEFYGVPYSNDMANFFFYENQQIIHQPIDQRYLTQRYTEKAIDYIERHSEAPFFLYLAHSMPHVPLYVSPEFEGSSGTGLYGDVVQELDWSTGQIIDSLDDLGLLDNTLVIFSSDNGPWRAMGDHGGSAGTLRDGKGSTFEGGQKVPTVVHWPYVIEAGRIDNSVTSLLDLMPTFSAIAGVPLPSDRVIDGVDISGLLTGDESPQPGTFFYNSAGESDIVGFRDGDWKLKLPRQGYPGFLEPILKLDRYSHDLMLFNLGDDPSERDNVADKFPQRVAEMTATIADLEAGIAENPPRQLYMSSTSSDRQGYGGLIFKASMLSLTALLLVLGLIYGVYKLLRRLILRGRR